jgi:PncC family amidohydrolase
MNERDRIVDSIKHLNLTISTVESLTGGLLASSFISFPGASHWFLGGLIPYTSRLKQVWCRVPPSLMEQAGTVQEEVVRQLALEGLRQSQAHICLATTGNAGPTSDTFTDVGECFIAITNGHITRVEHLFLTGNRLEVREEVVNHSWKLLKQFLSTY